MKKNLLMVITQGGIGGAQHHVQQLARHFQNTGFTVTIAFGGNDNQFNSLVACGVRMKPLRFMKRAIHPWYDLLGLFELYRFIRSFPCAVVHLHSSKAGILGSLACGMYNFFHPKTRLKVVYTAHGWHFLEQGNVLSRTLSMWCERFASFFRDHVICVSTADLRAATRNHIIVPSKLITIHNGNEPIRYHSREESRAKLLSFSRSNQSREIIIGTIANLYPTKGLTFLISAVPRVLTFYSQIRCVIIGAGPQQEELFSMVKRLGLESIIIFSGTIPQAGSLLSGFDIFILPSIKEGFPYVLLEAMGAGVPIIATTVGGVPEIVQHGRDAWLVPPGDACSLSAGIEKLLNEPDFRNTLSSNARQRLQLFSLDTMLHQTAAIYEKTMTDSICM